MLRGMAEKPDWIWSDESGKKWARLQARTDVQLEPLGRLAMNALELRTGERVLDVGCGAGATVLELAERVGQSGSVVGLDLSEPLLERARERVAASGRTNIELKLGDAAKASFEQPFDALFSRFGVMFFDDPVGAFRNLRAALKRGGRLGFVCWQAADRNPWGQEALDAVRAVAPNQPTPEMLAPGKPGPFSFADEARVRSILESAGFSAIRTDPSEIPMQIGGANTLEDAVDFMLEIGPAARFVSEADPALRSSFRDALSRWVAAYACAQGVWMPARTLIVTAQSA
jgi:ubiquinone/menaquinone biosynthesis C-methylase UbiE